MEYDKAKEINESINNPEIENYRLELTTGKFRNANKYKKNFKDAGYDINNL